MKKKELLKTAAAVAAAFTISATVGFGLMSNAFGTGDKTYAAESTVETQAEDETATTSDTGTASGSLNMVTGGAIDTTDLFTDRDLEQTPDLSEAVVLTVSDGTLTFTLTAVRADWFGSAGKCSET